MPSTILVVDDEANWRALLRRALESEGYRVETAADGDEALALAWTNPPALIILDHHMPGMDGVEVCGQLRRHPRSRDIPIIMLTVRQDTASKVRALETGADDYVTKPCDLQELRARVRARLRRPPAVAPTALGGGLQLDPARRVATLAGHPLPLTRREFDLFAVLAREADRVVSRETIIREVWGGAWDADANLLDVYIRRLRRKLAAAQCPGRIRTLWGRGYMYEPTARTE